jgi:hypothetical protein
VKRALLLVPLALLLGACVTIPTGPSVMVLPGSGKSFEAFSGDDATCRQWAVQQTGTTANKAATDSGVTSAVVGTAIGAAAGAAIGAAAGNPALGAAVGGGGGLLMGSAYGADAAGRSGRSVQSRYDVAYMQCMYAKGNQIPVSRGSVPYAPQRASTPPPPPPPAAAPALPPNVPPPPAGMPPPPPPPPPPPRG